MKAFVFALCLASTLAFSPASYASPITFNVTNGTFQSGGTFSGVYTLDSVTDEILGGQFTLIEGGLPYVENYYHPTFWGPPGNSTEAIFGGGAPIGAGAFYFSTSLSQTAPILCTYINESSCLLSSEFDFNFGDDSDYATGATITPAVSPTPEPSSLILLATGALGVAAAVHRRMRSASPRL